MTKYVVRKIACFRNWSDAEKKYISSDTPEINTTPDTGNRFVLAKTEEEFVDGILVTERDVYRWCDTPEKEKLNLSLTVGMKIEVKA